VTQVKDPDRARNLAIRILGHAVDDDGFLRIFGETSTLIRASATLCENENNDLFAEDELHYVEELLGLSFVLLQAKIRRVDQAAKAQPLGYSDARAFGSPYKDTNRSLVSLIWAVANYYKHQNEWGAEEWSDETLDPKTFSHTVRNQIERARQTRKIVQKVGICRSSSGNMRTAYEYFGIDWASDCTPLADKMQDWAKSVYHKCANP
jgi:hypothetical protein